MWMPKTDCTGCGACEAICPKGAITMVADGEGFLYPEIQSRLCVDCGRCRGACPPFQGVLTHESPVAWGAKPKDDAIRGEFDCRPFDLNQAVAANPSARVSAPAHPKREEFFQKLGTAPVDTLIWNCLEPKPQKISLLRRVLGRIRRTK